MGSQQSGASAEAMQLDTSVMKQAYGIGLPLLQRQQGLVTQGLAQGEPDYMKQAFGAQRGAITDAILYGGQQEQAARDRASSGLVQGGNVSSIIDPLDVGAKLAQQLFSSRTTEALGNVEQMNKLMGMGMGVGQTAGSAALGAGANQLRAIGSMADYNPTYAAIMGGVNAAGSVYGGMNQAGMFGGGGGNMGGGWVGPSETTFGSWSQGGVVGGGG